ncbi:MAG: carbon-nitrogen hydrolase family protein [Pseudomonadota bacterium]
MVDGQSNVSFHAACVQINAGQDVDENLAKIARFVSEAASQNIDLVLLPENFVQMPESGSTRYIEQWDGNQSSKVRGAIQQLSREHKISIVAGSLPVKFSAAQALPYAHCFVTDKTGAIVADYNKVHLFDVSTEDGSVGGARSSGSQTYRESDDFMPGDPQQFDAAEPSAKVSLSLAGLELSLGLTICYDLRFPEVYRRLGKVGCQVIFVPAAFTYVTGQQHWETLLRARAIENQCFIIAAGQCGYHAQSNNEAARRTWGHSMIIDAGGHVLAKMGHEEGLLSCELDLSKQIGLRQRFPVLQHDRL